MQSLNVENRAKSLKEAEVEFVRRVDIGRDVGGGERRGQTHALHLEARVRLRGQEVARGGGGVLSARLASCSRRLDRENT